MKKFWEEELETLLDKRGKNPKYRWKIIHMIVIKNNLPINVRGTSAVEGALKIADYWIKSKTGGDDFLTLKEKQFLNKLVGGFIEE